MQVLTQFLIADTRGNAVLLHHRAIDEVAPREGDIHAHLREFSARALGRSGYAFKVFGLGDIGAFGLDGDDLTGFEGFADGDRAAFFNGAVLVCDTNIFVEKDACILAIKVDVNGVERGADGFNLGLID